MDKIGISNFRKINQSWNVNLLPVTFFIGTNNSGKSTIFKAILLLEDFVKSNNHFELDFNGDNSRKHKIDCYSNAINRFNRNNFELNLELNYSNKGHDISIVFCPQDIVDGAISKGKLATLIIKNQKNESRLIIENTSGKEYILKLDMDFLNTDMSVGSDQKKLEELSLIATLENLIESDEKELIDLKEEGHLLESTLNDLIQLKKHPELDKNSMIRLNKVLRELNISLDRAIEFLQMKGIVIEARPTTKITPDIYELLLDEFETDYMKKSASRKIYDARIEEKIANKELTLSYLGRRNIELNNQIKAGKKKLTELRKSINNEKSKKLNKIVLMPEFSLTDFETGFLTIDSIIRKVLPKYLMEEQEKFGNSDENIELKRAYDFGSKIIQVLRFSVDHLSPHRNNQTRLYINNDTSSDINELIKEHSLSPISKSTNAGKFLKKWMIEFDIGKDFKIKQIEGLATQIEIIYQGQKINLADKGFGAGQIFTILLKIALSIDIMSDYVRTVQKGYRSKGIEEFTYLILIEEPEANLHPALQSKLADLFYEAYKEFGIRFVLETHSEYIVRRSQVLVKQMTENNSDKDTIELPFASRYFDQEIGPYEMEYRNDGVFKNDFGEGFFDVASRQSIELLKRKR